MYRRRMQGWLKHLDFMLQELLCFQIAFYIACFIRHGWSIPYAVVLYRNTAVVVLLLQIFVIISLNIFKDVLWRGYYNEFKSTVKTVLYVMLLFVFYLFLIQQGANFSRFVLIGTAGYYLILAYMLRCVRKYFLRHSSREKQGSKSLVLMTTRDHAKNVLKRIQNKNVGEFTVTGIIYLDCEPKKDARIGGVPVVAGMSGAVEYICRDWVDEVFFAIPQMDDKYHDILYAMADMSIVVHICVGSQYDFPMQKRIVEKFGEFTVVTMTLSILNLREAFAKRLMDIVGGFVGCLLTGIFTVILAPFIWIKSPGPIFFSQMRVGRNGKLFKMYKFRSMYPDAEERKQELLAMNEVEDGYMFKIENDPRIIGSEKGAGKGIGNFIRKTSLDEFPQFFNVLKGDMSLVGTRPPTLDEWEKYEPHHRGRMSIRPGITGMWQVSGRSDVMDFEEVVALDRDYISRWSIGLDIKILLKTVVSVVKGRGAR